jgi:hypothetical protein
MVPALAKFRLLCITRKLMKYTFVPQRQTIGLASFPILIGNNSCPAFVPNQPFFMHSTNGHFWEGKEFKIAAFLVLAAFWQVGSACASMLAFWKALGRQSAKACIAQSGLTGARVRPVIRFSDRIMVDIRTVDGRYAQRHMKRAWTKMLCAYNRKSQRAEVQELK